jgi:hypothetical protein
MIILFSVRVSNCGESWGCADEKASYTYNEILGTVHSVLPSRISLRKPNINKKKNNIKSPTSHQSNHPPSFSPLIPLQTFLLQTITPISNTKNPSLTLGISQA